MVFDSAFGTIFGTVLTVYLTPCLALSCALCSFIKVRIVKLVRFRGPFLHIPEILAKKVRVSTRWLVAVMLDGTGGVREGLVFFFIHGYFQM